MTRCNVDGCTRPAYSRDLCEPHYRRPLRTGSGSPTRPIGEPPPLSACSVDGCDRTATERGWCHAHYLRWTRLGEVQADQAVGRRRQPEHCTAEGCTRPAKSKGLCPAHYSRWLASGDVRANVPIRQSGPRGSGTIQRLGYRYVPVPQRDRHLTNGVSPVAEHRLVMARHLGRPLAGDENVHHRNGDRLDNRIENLEVWCTSQPQGQRIEDKVGRAREILERYAPGSLILHVPPSGFEPPLPP